MSNNVPDYSVMNGVEQQFGSLATSFKSGSRLSVQTVVVTPLVACNTLPYS